MHKARAWRGACALLQTDDSDDESDVVDAGARKLERLIVRVVAVDDVRDVLLTTDDVTSVTLLHALQ